MATINDYYVLSATVVVRANISIGEKSFDIDVIRDISTNEGETKFSFEVVDEDVLKSLTREESDQVAEVAPLVLAEIYEESKKNITNTEETEVSSD